MNHFNIVFANPEFKQHTMICRYLPQFDINLAFNNLVMGKMVLDTRLGYSEINWLSNSSMCVKNIMQFGRKNFSEK